MSHRPQSKDPKKRDPLVHDTTGKALSESPKQVRARLRRRAEKHGALSSKGRPTGAEVELLYSKPIEEWDDEELARGRPRDKNGQFKGRAPQYISRDMQERAFQLFTQRLRQENAALSITAQKVIDQLLSDDERDDNGKPIVPAAVKARLAEGLLDRVLGKATTPVQAELSVKLEAVLAEVMVNADGELSSTHAQIVDLGAYEDDDDEEEFDDDDE